MWADSTFEDLVQYNDGFRTQLIGTPEQIAERTAAYRKRGVDLILGGFLHFQEEIEYFGAKVLPLVREIEADSGPPRSASRSWFRRSGREHRGVAVAKDAPVGFREIRVLVDLKTDEPAERIELLTRLTERYCVVFQTLARPPVLELAAVQH